VAPPPPAKAARRGLPWLGLTLGCGAVVLMVAAIGVAVVAGLRAGEPLQGLLARPAAPQPYVWDVPPNPYAEFKSPALDVTPMPGVRITAPEGALDQPRQFTARLLGPNEAKAARDKLQKQGMLVVAALDLDAGMNPEERFRQPVTIAFDLQQLGVDPALWPYTQVVALDEQGAPMLMASTVNGAQLSWRTMHNGAIFTTVLYMTMTTLLHEGLLLPDLRTETEGKRWFGIWSSGGNFYVQWPADRHSPSPQGEAAFAEMERLQKLAREYATYRSPLPPTEDARLKELWTQFRTREWAEQHWAHPAAFPVADSLEFAYVYLERHRRFNPPGHVVHVYLRSPWKLKPEIKGTVENLKTRNPFISINLDAIPIKARGDKPAGEAGVGVEVTLLHELFHVFQSQYGSSGYWDRNVLWVGEATALTLEREIWEDELYRGRLGDEALYKQALTLRDQYWNAYRVPMEPLRLISGEEGLRRHGYGMSFFFEYFKRNVFADREGAFLSAFYNALNQQGSAAGALEALARARGKSLGALYAGFVSAHADHIAMQPGDPQQENIAILPRARSREWTQADVPPLSSPIYRIAIGDHARGYDKAVAVVETRSLPREIKLRTRGLTMSARSPWVDIAQPVTVVTPTTQIRSGKPVVNGFLLQAIGAYAPMDDLLIDPPGLGLAAAPMDELGSWTVTFLLPPPRAPSLPQGPRIVFERASKPEVPVAGDTARIDFERGLEIRWERSPLAEREDFRYLIKARTLRDGKAIGEKTLLVEPAKTQATIAFAELLPAPTEAEKVRYEIRVTVSEALLLGDRQVEGAPSDEATIVIDIPEIDIPEVALPGKAFLKPGVWYLGEGFPNEVVLSQEGDVMIGRYPSPEGTVSHRVVFESVPCDSGADTAICFKAQWDQPPGVACRQWDASMAGVSLDGVSYHAFYSALFECPDEHGNFVVGIRAFEVEGKWLREANGAVDSQFEPQPTPDEVPHGHNPLGNMPEWGQGVR
jgi:hypothetical protein